MSIKLIATDLDGTLMSGDHLTVSPRTVAALQAATTVVCAWRLPPVAPWILLTM